MRLISTFRAFATRLRNDRSGQDLIEYALLCAAVVVIIAAILPPQLMPSVSTIFSRISLAMMNAS